jgi:hypothetical protein
MTMATKAQIARATVTYRIASPLFADFVLRKGSLRSGPTYAVAWDGTSGLRPRSVKTR